MVQFPGIVTYPVIKRGKMSPCERNQVSSVQGDGRQPTSTLELEQEYILYIVIEGKHRYVPPWISKGFICITKCLPKN